jgi:putative membrane protein
MYKAIKDFFNGMVFGITQTVPGVSGGTIAIILGFYFKLIEAINHFTENVRRHLKFLLPLAFGTAVGIVLFSSIINFLLANYSFPTMLFFIGLIVGVIPHIYSKVREGGRKLKLKEILLIMIPFLILLAMSGLKGVSVTDPEEAINNIDVPFMIFIFFAGMISAAALVIPGISGSFVLLLLGIYPLVIYSVSSIRFLLTDITNFTLMLDICKVLAPFGIGIIIGGLLTVRLIEKLFKKYHRAIYSVILGLLSGSVFLLFINPIVYKSGISPVIIIIGAATFFLGCVTAFCLGKKRI